jgi:hypothetical protein
VAQGEAPNRTCRDRKPLRPGRGDRTLATVAQARELLGHTPGSPPEPSRGHALRALRLPPGAPGRRRRAPAAGIQTRPSSGTSTWPRSRRAPAGAASSRRHRHGPWSSRAPPPAGSSTTSPRSSSSRRRTSLIGRLPSGASFASRSAPGSLDGRRRGPRGPFPPGALHARQGRSRSPGDQGLHLGVPLRDLSPGRYAWALPAVPLPRRGAEARRAPERDPGELHRAPGTLRWPVLPRHRGARLSPAGPTGAEREDGAI